MKITFVRHCETDWNKEERCQGVTDLELNTNGLIQAKKLGVFFEHEHFEYVFCSDLVRAKQTLDNINYDKRFNVTYSEKLREMDQGDFEGLSLSYLRKKYSNELRIWRENPENFRLPKGETLGEVRDRSMNYLKSIVKNLPGKSSILIVTHNLVIASLLCTISKKELKFFADFTTSSGAISRVKFFDNMFSMEQLDFVDHLKSIGKIVKSAGEV
jgi:broad specificity phosphatase PhoE